MKHIIFPAIIFGVIALSGCSGADSHGEKAEGHHEEEEEAGLIELSDERAALLGIGLEAATPSPFSEVVKVGGQVETSPSAQFTATARSGGIVSLAPGIAVGTHVERGQRLASVSARGMAGGDANEAAAVAYAAAKKEVERLRPLAADGIVTRRDLNAAEQRLAEATAAMGSSTGAGSVVTAPGSGVITSLDIKSGEYVEAGTAVATISGNGALRLRADLPESRINVLSDIEGARFQPAYSEEIFDIVTLGGRRVASPTAVAQGGSIPVWFDFQPSDSRTVAGTYCQVWLLGAQRDSVITVPAEAVAEQQGKYFVYTKLKPGHFIKRPVEIGQSDGQRIELRSGIAAGDSIVTRGSQFVRLAESATVAPEGHSHHH